jgi:hypothetical protein
MFEMSNLKQSPKPNFIACFEYQKKIGSLILIKPIMKISGFTIVRNAILNDYPVVAAIRSILPMVDEMIVCIDKGDDDSEGLIRSIADDKIRIFYADWDMRLKPIRRCNGCHPTATGYFIYRPMK